MKKNPLVLVVEDHCPTRRMMARTLESAGFRAQAAADVLEGIGMARRERPDLILMDVDLPGLNGDVAVGALKDDPSLGEVPVVLVSAIADLDDRRRKAGADGSLFKPFRPCEIVHCAQRWTKPEKILETDR